MSPRAAWRLESLGFTKVYDYVGGKADWFAAGLPREGKLTSIPRAGDVARRDDVTCRPTDRISDVIERVRAAGKETCIVTTDGRVVLGRVRTDRLDGDAQVQVQEVMELQKRMKIGELAKETGLTAKTIRFYEGIQLLDDPGRTESGYRQYGAEDVERLEFIKKAKRLGLSLDEIRRRDTRHLEDSCAEPVPLCARPGPTRPKAGASGCRHQSAGGVPPSITAARRGVT